MKIALTILAFVPGMILCLCSCASRPLASRPSTVNASTLEPRTVIAPVEGFTLHIGFSNPDTNSAFPDEWTNVWTCDALASLDPLKPRAEWDRFPNVTLSHYQGELSFAITSNTPRLYVTAEFQRRAMP